MKHFLLESLRFNAMTWLSARVFSKRVDSRLVRSLMALILTTGRGSSKSDRRSVIDFLKVLQRLNSRNGPTFTIKWLKVQYVNFQQSVGANPLKDLSPLGAWISRSGDGLPRVIPRPDRVLIRSGDTATIRKWITLFGLYRELKCPGVLKLSTITDPCTGDPFTPMMDPERFKELFRIGDAPSLEAKAFDISSAGAPKSGVTAGSAEGILASLYAWNKVSYSHILHDWKTFTGSLWLDRFFKEVIRYSDPLKYDVDPVLGRLGFKEEAAGKVRVFAMVDPITQWLLKPLHDWAFSILRRIPMDGTFDQIAPLRFVDWSTTHYSFDLSAATDRIPVQLAERLLSSMIGEEGARLWVQLLVGRPYFNSKSKDWVYYKCGQPMGALTSWSVGLALVHHWIVQSAAQRAGYTRLFRRYALLGDDIVLWDDKVAFHYQEILKELGVGISLPKSLISQNGLEFAKRFFYKGEDCSPSAFGEWWTATHNLGAAVEFGRHFKFETAYQWKRALGLTRTQARNWGRISTIYSVLWNYSHRTSLYDFYRHSVKGAIVIRPENQWRGLCASYYNRVASGFNRTLSYLDTVIENLDSPWTWDSVILSYYRFHGDRRMVRMRLLELYESVKGTKLDPGNLDLMSEALRDSRIFSLHYDEQKFTDKVRLWTVQSFKRLSRDGFI